MRQVIALFDEYQSKENAKHVLRSMKENARQGFWNGARPPFGYRTVEVERRGSADQEEARHRSVEAEDVRLIFRLFLEGDDGSGPMGVKAIATWLNEHGHRTRSGARWGVGPLHKLLTNPVYAAGCGSIAGGSDPPAQGRSRSTSLRCPPIIDCGHLRCVQEQLKSRNPKVTPPTSRHRSDPADRSGDLCHVRRRHDDADRHVQSGRVHRYYSCSTCARNGQDRLQGALDPDGQARHPGDEPADRQAPGPRPPQILARGFG